MSNSLPIRNGVERTQITSRLVVEHRCSGLSPTIMQDVYRIALDYFIDQGLFLHLHRGFVINVICRESSVGL